MPDRRGRPALSGWEPAWPTIWRARGDLATPSARSLKKMRLTDLPADVLPGIVGRLDQADKVACLTACRALSAAADSAGVWSRVTFRDLDFTAVAFMHRHRCPAVTIVSECPDDVSWFFDQLAARDIVCVEDLTIHLGEVQRVPHDFFAGLSQQAALRRVEVTVDELDESSEVVFPASACLGNLRELHISDHSSGSDTEGKQLVVWFADSHARFSALHTVYLDVAVSDVMAGLRHMPALRHVQYRCNDEETYEDAEMEGATLDVLELNVGADASYPDLWRELEKCAVRKLVLCTTDDWMDVSQPLHPALEELHVLLHAPATEIRIDFPSLATLTRLRVLRVVAVEWIEPAPSHLIFSHAAPPDWIEFFRSRTLDLPPACRVTMSFAA